MVQEAGRKTLDEALDTKLNRGKNGRKGEGHEGMEDLLRLFVICLVFCLLYQNTRSGRAVKQNMLSYYVPRSTSFTV